MNTYSIRIDDGLQEMYYVDKANLEHNLIMMLFPDHWCLTQASDFALRVAY